jgi:ketosteroid isomerase-like protein
MSSGNAELVQAVLGAYVQGDEETLRGLMDPDVEIHTEPGLINAGTYHGLDGFFEWTDHWEEAWDDVDYELGEMIDIDEHRIVVPVRIVGRGAGSGLEVDSTFGWMYEWKNGRSTRFHVYSSVDGAVEAAERLAGSE